LQAAMKKGEVMKAILWTELNVCDQSCTLGKWLMTIVTQILDQMFLIHQPQRKFLLVLFAIM
jgi:hypothetical protein